ncbi:MAG: TonB-dependent siderophore receptor [Pseudomonadota bacterium]
MKVTKTSPRLAPDNLRMTISRLLLGGSAVFLSAPLLAAAAPSVEEILIQERQPQGYKVEDSTLSKLTESLSDTPQTISVITDKLMDDRAVMSLTDALRNVPGITLGAGEFSWQGNNPNIRGFNSRNDMFLDGMRDFGNYDRDPFNLQSIEVLQGPSSMVFGRGSTGGVINQASKMPVEDQLRSVHLNVGNADTRRLVVDLNQPLSPTAAVRLNVMKHDSEVPDRDGAAADRFGVAPSLSLELGSATRLTLSYMHQGSDNTPDYGLPWLAGKPADVERNNYYGFDTDYVNTDAGISTINLEHALNENNRLQAIVRYADYERSTRITEPLLVGTPTATTPLDTVRVNRNVFRGESNERIFQGQLNLISNFSTGILDHTLVTGLEAAQENSSPGFGFALGVPTTPILDPVEEPFTSTGVAWRALTEADGESLAAFALDTIKFGDQWQLVTGVRWDRFEVDYNGDRFNDNGSFLRNESIQRTVIKKSYRAALVYKPVEAGTVYLGWGTSFNPSAEGLSFINSGRALTVSDSNLDPETNRSAELGVKWQLFNDALNLDAALFHIEKSNARVPDPATPGFNILAGAQTVTGFSINATGSITNRISVSGGYTWLDSEQEKTTQVTVLPGTPLANVPENTFSAWISYTPLPDLQIGVGGRYVDERLATITQPVKEVPDYFALDAMVSYQATNNVRLKLNLTNFTDEYYFDQLHPFHVVPGPGLGAVFAINLDY